MKLTNITPRTVQCGIGACPAIFRTDQGTYVLVGKKVTNPELATRVGKDEAAIEVPKFLLEGLFPGMMK